MNVKHIVHVSEVLLVETAFKQNRKTGETIPKKQADGSPVYALLCKFKAKQKFGLKEIEVEITGKLDCALDIKPGAKNLTFECEQYVMTNENGGKPSLHYRAVRIVDSGK